MLILTRKEEESIIIDDNIEVKIMEVDNGRVKLGVEAPESIPIHREEIYRQIKFENKLAAAQPEQALKGLSKLLKKDSKGDNNEEK